MMRPGAVLAVFLVLLGSVPLVLPEFYVTLMNYIGLYAIGALGLVLLTGVAGLISFGQAAFVGLGAYTTAYLTTAAGVPGWLASPCLALLAGLPLGTIAWGISLYFLFGNLDFIGGFTGITGIPALRLFGHELGDGRQFYYLIWLALLAMVWAAGNLLDSRSGRAIRALKGGCLMAEAMGVDTARLKNAIFLIAAL